MIGLQGPSRIITNDEVLDVFEHVKSVLVDGKYVYPKTRTFKVRCNVQPLGSRDLLLVPEGDRFKEQLWLFSSDVDSMHLLRDNQRVQRNGVNYQVQGVQPWGSYVQARLMRIDVGPDKTP